jgi:hypothetical protein
LRLLVDSEQKPISREAWEGAEREDGLGRYPLAVRELKTNVVGRASGKAGSDWVIRAVVLEDRAGVRVTANGSRLKKGGEVVLQGTIDVDAHYPGGVPLRAVVALEGLEAGAQ